MRKSVFVDPTVQGALIVKIVLYWAVCLISVTATLLCWRIVVSPGWPVHVQLADLWSHYGPAAIAAILLLPLMIVDSVRLSNRFVGPLLRLRRSLRELARGEAVEPLEFRGADFWQEIADEFNAVRARVVEPDDTATTVSQPPSVI